MTKEQIRQRCVHRLRECRKQESSGRLPSLPPEKFFPFLPKTPTPTLVFMATPLEPKTDEILNYFFLETSHQIFIPNTSGSSPAFTHLTPKTSLTKTTIHTYEDPSPERLFHANDFSSDSICIVSCLGVNQTNHRLGYGSGFYDRFLEYFPGTSIGIVHHKNIVDFTPEAHDIRLDMILTW